MNSELQTAKIHTFIDIFSAEFSIEDEKVKLSEIVIPKIQRDYAQGRNEADVFRVRKRFLAVLKEAIISKNTTLDFVYGDIDENGRMTPLDGQQRLTTLFLLHVYAAKKEGIDSGECEFLNKFTYETRYSATEFCSFLVNEYSPSFDKVLSSEIIDQSWFPLDWQKDPTINSMLVMLDAIHECFADVPNIWTRLKEGAISFYFLLIKDMGLTDELYIKMNSRGKPLTQFEHLKAELERTISEIDKDLAKSIMSKIDKEWTDLLWLYRKNDNINDNIIDDEFLRYFHFICDIICYQSGGTPQGKSDDEFDLLNEYFSKDSKEADINIQKFNSMFDCWCNLGNVSPGELIGKFVSKEHEFGKVCLNTVDIFEDCLRNYGDVLGNGNRKFPLNSIVLLFAVVTYLQNKDIVTEEEFARRLRIVNNIVQNSEDEISDSENRTSGNRMPAILKQVEKIIVLGTIDTSIDKAMNVIQLNEEIEKEEWLKNNQDKAEALFELEDHELLQGQISIVGLDDTDLYPRFKSLFDCDWDLIDCALMSIGLYAQRENSKRYQIGSGSRRNITAWRNLFHKSQSNISGGQFDTTKKILCELLSKTHTFTDDYLNNLIKDYISLCESKSEYPLQYYYIKYPHFRPGSYGKYYWSEGIDKLYELSVLLTKSQPSESSYQPFLKTIDDAHLSTESRGKRIVLENVYVLCVNDAYVVFRNDNDEEVYRIDISQNDDGIDTENRLEKLKNLYHNIIELNASIEV